MNEFKSSEDIKNKLIISLGDPAGIGTEIILKALGSKFLNKKIQPLLVGCKKNIYTTFSKLIKHGKNNIPDPNNLNIIDIPLEKMFFQEKLMHILVMQALNGLLRQLIYF